MDEFEQYKRPTEAVDEFAQYKRPVEVAPTPAAKNPGFLEPGSVSEAAVRGLSQGVTLGFGDELSAGVRAILDSNKQPGESYVDTYRRMRDAERMSNSSAAQANPVAYTGGQLLGTAATSVLAAPITPASGIAKVGSFNAITGALAGAGNSDSASYGDNAMDALKSGGTTAALGGIAQGIGAGIQGVSNVAKTYAGKATGNVLAKSGDMFESSLGKAIQKSPELLDHVKPTYLSDVIPSAGHTAKAVLNTVVDGVKHIDKKDVLAAGLGALTAGPMGMLNAVIGKRVLVDKTGEAVVEHINEIGAAARPMINAVQQKFAPVIKQALQKGTPFVAINNVLQQQSPEYREMLRAQDKLKEQDGQ